VIGRQFWLQGPRNGVDDAHVANNAVKGEDMADATFTTDADVGAQAELVRHHCRERPAASGHRSRWAEFDGLDPDGPGARRWARSKCGELRQAWVVAAVARASMVGGEWA